MEEPAKEKYTQEATGLRFLLQGKLGGTVDFLAGQLGVSFVVGGSWPVFLLAQVLVDVGRISMGSFLFNDIDVYVGEAGVGDFKMVKHRPPMDVPTVSQKVT